MTGVDLRSAQMEYAQMAATNVNSIRAKEPEATHDQKPAMRRKGP